MAEENNNEMQKDQEIRQDIQQTGQQNVIEEDYQDPNLGANSYSAYSDYNEETAAEIAAPVNATGTRENANTQTAGDTATGGAGLGWLALALSIISLFVMPMLMGIAGIIIGFIARRRGANGLGAWAIGIGALSIILSTLILPFIY